MAQYRRLVVTFEPHLDPNRRPRSARARAARRSQACRPPDAWRRRPARRRSPRTVASRCAGSSRQAGGAPAAAALDRSRRRRIPTCSPRSSSGPGSPPAHARRRRNAPRWRPAAASARRAAGLRPEPRTTRMAECCSLSYRQLAWATESYLGDEQCRPPTTSSSTTCISTSSPRTGHGAFSARRQRSPARGRAANATSIARESGFRRGSPTSSTGAQTSTANTAPRSCPSRTRGRPHARGDPAHPAARSPSTRRTPTAPRRSCSRSSTSSACGSSRG